MMKITGLSHLFKWENLHHWWLTKYFFCLTVFSDCWPQQESNPRPWSVANTMLYQLSHTGSQYFSFLPTWGLQGLLRLGVGLGVDVPGHMVEGEE